MIKKILYVAFKYEYGNPKNGTALNYKAWYESLLTLGYDMESIFYEDYSHDELQKRILSVSQTSNVDMVFFILQKDQIEIETLKALKEQGVFTVNFFGDDQWRFESFTKFFAPHFSVCITTDKFSLEKYRKINQKNVVLSQWGSLSNDAMHVLDSGYKFEITFVGGKSRYREWFVKKLKEEGLDIKCFGNGWANGRVSYGEMEDIFMNSKINLNISNSISYDLRYVFSTPRTVVSTIRSIVKGGKNSSQTKARNFEIPVQGGFQVTDYVPSLEDYFHIGKEVVCYNNVDEAGKVIKYYLDHDSEREQIREAGIRRARSNHTFMHRTTDFMVSLSQLKESLCE